MLVNETPPQNIANEGKKKLLQFSSEQTTEYYHQQLLTNNHLALSNQAQMKMVLCSPNGGELTDCTKENDLKHMKSKILPSSSLDLSVKISHSLRKRPLLKKLTHWLKIYFSRTTQANFQSKAFFLFQFSVQGQYNYFVVEAKKSKIIY